MGGRRMRRVSENASSLTRGMAIRTYGDLRFWLVPFGRWPGVQSGACVRLEERALVVKVENDIDLDGVGSRNRVLTHTTVEPAPGPGVEV